MRHLLPALGAATILLACSEPPSGPPAESSREPVRVVQADGDQQNGPAGMALPTPMAVMVTDNAGRGVAGVVVRFAVNGGGGWTTESEVVTDAFGRASTIWYMGPRPGNANFLGVYTPVGTTGFRASVTALEANATYRGFDGYNEMKIGSLPLLLSAAHGGTLAPAAITARTSATPADVFSAELANEIVSAVGAHGRGKPSLVVTHVATSRVDTDLIINEGTEGDRVAERTWREYHSFLAAARAHMQDTFTRGLYVDLHGHQHAAERVELGYLLTASELAAPNGTLDDRSFPLKSSIRAIAQENHPAFSSILRGDASLGALLAAEGFRTMPSPAEPAPGNGTYLAGGVSLERYGSKDGSLVSGILLQTPFTGVRDTPANRTRFANSFADALDQYFSGFYGNALFSR